VTANHETKRHCLDCGKPLPYRRTRKTLLCQRCNGKRVGRRAYGDAGLACVRWLMRVAHWTDDLDLAVRLIYQASRVVQGAR
jgi:DNA-directed RNA polymerase subunit RPC12/RpoP